MNSSPKPNTKIPKTDMTKVLVSSSSLPGTPRTPRKEQMISTRSLPSTPRSPIVQPSVLNTKTMKRRNRDKEDDKYPKTTLSGKNTLKKKASVRKMEREDKMYASDKNREEPVVEPPPQKILLPLSARMDIANFTEQFSEVISSHIQQIVCLTKDAKQYILADSVNYILNIRKQSGGASSGTITYEAPDKASVNAKDIMKIPFSGNVAPADYKANVICTGSSPEGIYLCILLKILIPDLEVAILKESDTNGTHKISDPAIVFVKMLHTFGVDEKTMKNEVTQGAMCDGEELSEKLYSGNVRGGVLNIFPSCFYTSKDAKEYKKIFNIQAENENVAIQMNMLEYFLTRRAQELGILVLHSGAKASLEKEATQYMSEDTIALFDTSNTGWTGNAKSSIYYAYGKNTIVPGVKLPKQSGYDNLSSNKYGFYFASKNKLTVESNLTKYVKNKPDIKVSSVADICNVSSIRDDNGVKIISVGPALRSNHVFNSGFGYYGFADAYIFAMLFKKMYDFTKIDPDKPPPPPDKLPPQKPAPTNETPSNENIYQALSPPPPPFEPPKKEPEKSLEIELVKEESKSEGEQVNQTPMISETKIKEDEPPPPPAGNRFNTFLPPYPPPDESTKNTNKPSSIKANLFIEANNTGEEIQQVSESNVNQPSGENALLTINANVQTEAQKVEPQNNAMLINEATKPVEVNSLPSSVDAVNKPISATLTINATVKDEEKEEQKEEALQPATEQVQPVQATLTINATVKDDEKAEQKAEQKEEQKDEALQPATEQVNPVQVTLTINATVKNDEKAKDNTVNEIPSSEKMDQPVQATLTINATVKDEEKAEQPVDVPTKEQLEPVQATLTINATVKDEEKAEQPVDVPTKEQLEPVQATLTINATVKDEEKAEQPVDVPTKEQLEPVQATLTINATVKAEEKNEQPVEVPTKEQLEPVQATLTINATVKAEEKNEQPVEVPTKEQLEPVQATLTINATVKDEEKEKTPVPLEEKGAQATLAITATLKDAITPDASSLAEKPNQAILTITAKEQTEAQNVEQPTKANILIEATNKSDVFPRSEEPLQQVSAMLTINATKRAEEEEEEKAREEEKAEEKENAQEEEKAEYTKNETNNSSIFSGMFGCSQGALDQSLSKKLQEERDREIRMKNESNSGENPDAVKQKSSNKEEVMQKWDELKKDLTGTGSNLGSGLSTVASGLVKGTAGLFSKISSATTSKLKTVPYEMLNPSVKYLSIYINPGIEFMPKMLSKYSTSNSVQFNPLVRYSERVINSIPEGRPRTDIYEKLFNNQAFKVMLAETMSSLFGAQTKKTIKDATDAGIVDDNITTTLNTLFATGNVLYINDAPYTVYSYTWNGEWQVDTKVPNSFEYMVHPYQREGLFKYDEMQQAAAQKQLKELPQEILMSKKLQTRLEEPEEKEVEADTTGESFFSTIVNAIKPTVKSSQVRAIDKATVPQGTTKAGLRAVNASLRRYKAFMPNDSNKWDVEVDPYVFTLFFEDRDKLQEFIGTSTKNGVNGVNGLKDKYAEVDALRTLYSSLSNDYNNTLDKIAQNSKEIAPQLSELATSLKDVPNSVGSLIEKALDKLGLRDKININNQGDISAFMTFLSGHVSEHIRALTEHIRKMPLYKCDKVGLLNNMFTRVKDTQLAINELVGKEAWEEISKSSGADTSKIVEFTKTIKQMQTIGADVIRLRETLIAGSNDSSVSADLTKAKTDYNEAFKALQDNKLLLKPLSETVDTICATEFQQIKSANGKEPVFAVDYKDKSITDSLTKLSKLKPFEMVALVDSASQMYMAEQMEKANTISKLYVEQTTEQQTLMERLDKKEKCTKDYYNKLSEFLTLLRSVIDKRDARINTLTTAIDADINMCKRIAALTSVKIHEEQVPLAYSDAYAMELIVVYSQCDATLVETMKNDVKMKALEHEMTTNVDFWKCIGDSSKVFGPVIMSVNTDLRNAQKKPETRKEPAKEEELKQQIEYEAMLTKIKMTEIVNLQKIQRLSQELYSIELDLYIHKQQEEKRETCSKHDNCMNTDVLKETTIWIEMTQSCTLLSAEAIQTGRIRRKTDIIKELDGIIGNFNKSLLNVFDSNKDSNVETSKVRMLCNAVASNEQIVVPTLDEFLKTTWTKQEDITRLFQLHIVSSVFAYMQKNSKPLKEILNVKYIENVNFWDVYEKTQETGGLLDAVATILNSELYLTSSTIDSEYCVDGQFDFVNNESEGVANLKNALYKKELKEQLNLLQQVFKIQFTVVKLIYDNDKKTHNMNIVGCDLELTKDDVSFNPKDVQKVEYCAFMIFYERKYYIPYNYKIGSFLYKKADLKKVSLDYVVMQGCNKTSGVASSIFRFDQQGGAEEDNKAVVQAQPVIAQAEPVIAQAQPVNASNYRIKMENTKESKLSYYIAVDLKLVPGKTLQLTDKLKMACEMNADNVRKDLSRLFGFMYVPKPPLLYTSSKQDKNTKQPLPSATSWMQTKLPDLIRDKNYSQVVGDDFVNLMKTKIHTSEKFKYAFMNLVIASNEYNEILKTHRISTEQLNNLITEARYLPVMGGKQSRRANKRAPRGTRKVSV
jgi:hypothetical protein